MKTYNIEDINSPVFSDYPIINAENSKQAGEIYLKRKIKRVPASDNFRLRITPIIIKNGRKYVDGNSICYK